MAFTSNFKSKAISILAMGSLTFLMQACLISPNQESKSAQTSTDQVGNSSNTNSLTQTSIKSKVPKGCLLEWNEEKEDSVLYCPEFHPPKSK